MVGGAAACRGFTAVCSDQSGNVMMCVSAPATLLLLLLVNGGLKSGRFCNGVLLVHWL